MDRQSPGVQVNADPRSSECPKAWDEHRQRIEAAVRGVNESMKMSEAAFRASCLAMAEFAKALRTARRKSTELEATP